MGWDAYPSRSADRHDLHNSDVWMLDTLMYLQLSGNLLDYEDDPQIGDNKDILTSLTELSWGNGWYSPGYLSEAARQIQKRLEYFEAEDGDSFAYNRAQSMLLLLVALSTRDIGLIVSE